MTGRPQALRITAQLAAVTVAVVVGLLVTIDLNRFDIRAPISYKGDSAFTVMVCNTAITDGWYWRNARLGMPSGQRMYDFPNFDPTSMMIMKLFGLFFSNTAVVYNLFVFSTFFLAAISAYLVARAKQLSVYASFIIAFAFAFSPFKLDFFEAGVYHFSYSFIFIGNIFVIPLVTWLVLSLVALDDREPRTSWLMYGLACVLIGLSSAYHMFFACFFIGIAALFRMLYYRKLAYGVVPAVLVTIILFFFFLTALPSLLFTHNHGNNPVVARRLAFESQMYALTITNLLFPDNDSPLTVLESYHEKYNETSQLPGGVNRLSRLGLAGSAGLLLLMVSLFIPKGHGTRSDTLWYLSIFAVAGILWSTIDGFNTIFAYLVNAVLRCQCRMGVFILFFALMATGIGIDYILNKLKTRTVAGYHIAGIFFVIPVILSSLQANHFRNESVVAQWQEEQQFVEQIEQILPDSSMVYQLPFIPFPEEPNVHQLYDYEQSKLCLHSDSLRWSYGSMRERDDRIHETLTTLPLPTQLYTMILLGFKGLVIYRQGYEDAGNRLIDRIKQLTGQEYITSNNGRMVFFDISSPGIQDALRAQTDRDIVYFWQDGVYVQEHDATDTWRWSQKDATLKFLNYTDDPIALTIRFGFISTNTESSATLTIRTPNTQNAITNQNGFAHVDETVEIPPGYSSIKFEFNGKPFPAPQDPRDLYFCMKNIAIEPKNPEVRLKASF